MKKSILFFIMLFSASLLMAQAGNPFNESSPNQPNQKNFAKGSWTLQFNHMGVPGGGSAGVESDGTHFYITKWNGTMIWKMDNTGTLVDSFSIPGVSGLRDLAYDGTYFYGGASANTIYKMDFTSKSLVGTINSPSVTVRNISYDASADSGNGGFWVANWDTDITLISRNGIVLQTIPAATHGQTSMYGSAYDTISSDGPFIWVINANGNVPTTITPISVATGISGLAHNLTKDVCNMGEIGGGLFIQENIVSGTVTLGGLIQNTSVFGFDIATTEVDSLDLAVTSVNLPPMAPQGQNIDIEGVITNEGYIPVTSFDLNYKVGSGAVITESITGINISSFATYNYTHSTPWSPTVGNQVIKVWVSNPNGMLDENNVNDTTTMNIFVYDPSSTFQKLPLHEGFTSSTCAPCASGNPVVKAVLDNNPNKWTLVKYQMSWPGDGDPYFTIEGQDRRVFYNVNSVPNLKVEGGYAFDGNSASYTAADLNTAYAIPAFVEIIADLTILPGDKSVEVEVDVNNIIDLPAGAKLYVAIVEKETSNNVGTNGETSFDYVMKKMLPNANGTTIGPLTTGTNHSQTLNYTFKGNYRLPDDAGDPINHSTEHSVEEFSDLIAVVWVQNSSSMEVYQSAFSSVTVGFNDADLEDLNISIYPNPTSDILKVELNNENSTNTVISVVDNLGKEVYKNQTDLNNVEINVENLPEGVYFVRVQNDKGSYTKPIIVN